MRGTGAEIARIIHAAEPLGNGRYHVPCVRVGSEDPWGREEVRWWPIQGRWHEDSEIIEFPLWHWHIDWRFVSSDERASAGSNSFLLPAKVITAAMIRPVGECGPDVDAVEGPEGSLPGAASALWLRHEIRTMAAEGAALWPHDTRWMKALEQRYANARLGGANGWICPHQGADLETVAGAGQDTVQCPLHGLRWCTRTGKLAPREEAREGGKPHDKP